MSPQPQSKAASPLASQFDQPSSSRVNDNRSHRDDHVNWWHLITHGVAFCVAPTVAAIVLSPYYPKFRDQTESAEEAFGAFLTLCVVFGGLGPLVTLLLFGVQRLAARRRSTSPVSWDR